MTVSGVALYLILVSDCCGVSLVYLYQLSRRNVFRENTIERNGGNKMKEVDEKALEQFQVKAQDRIDSLNDRHRGLLEKHTYFLNAAAGACIGFSMTQLKGSAWSWELWVFLIAVICWGGSFYCGCNHVGWLMDHLSSNVELVRARARIGKYMNAHKAAREAAEANAKQDLKRADDAGAVAWAWQWRLFLAGCFFFIAWQLLLIWLSSP